MDTKILLIRIMAQMPPEELVFMTGLYSGMLESCIGTAAACELLRQAANLLENVKTADPNGN